MAYACTINAFTCTYHAFSAFAKKKAHGTTGGLIVINRYKIIYPIITLFPPRN